MASLAEERPAADLEAFRLEVRDWIEANFPKSLKGVDMSLSALEGPSEKTPDREAWRIAVGEKGWGTPTWPRQYGGGGLTGAEAKIIQQEFTRAGASNPIGGMGVMMFGPTLLEYGSEEQKMEHIPAICKAEVRWCQGYSEPNAGSDLANLQTFAEDCGDHYLVNGQKTWTSGGQWADKCFALVRTDKSDKHNGISFLLIDMTSPGVEVRPIKMISGVSPFCETFFTNVKVPKKNLVGVEGQGWTIGKRLLQHERTNIGSGARNMVSISALAKKQIGVDEQGRIADPELRARIARLEMDGMAFFQTAMRVQAEGGVSVASSILKTSGTKLAQERAELIIEIMGMQGLGWEGEGFSEKELEAVRGWLFGKATTIFGGSTEIQTNIVAKRILGMLDHQ
ncbi:acyl-CoA dehydrogenase [Sphingomonas lacunae]|uniref:Acyl-CoA dehydrogenase n=1 Tax=Sphingomonas lacunae TaxID=2698828 RepID=A0A6M4AS58_9SPHN|nr:acyl-CoA dehydrogenase family protein [Sphingomonas lacunae]QJQ31250.1 acyl-CoA dehydrogenase [Sphingomonas lacunae]